jgi:uncharacterized protein YeaO (DUF488 family)
MIRTKRWNDAREPDDGFRVLICRYRPRGVKKEDETWDAWCPALAPSVELHAAAYGKDDAPPIAWSEYEKRFQAEMSSQGYWLAGFAENVKRGETITLLCSSACTDEARCHRTLVKEMIEERAAPKKEKTANARVVRRR